MPNFKPKTNKKIEIDEKSMITVDSKHEELMNSFSKGEENIKVLKKEVKLLKKLINENNFETIDEKLEHTDRLNLLKRKTNFYYYQQTKLVLYKVMALILELFKKFQKQLWIKVGQLQIVVLDQAERYFKK